MTIKVSGAQIVSIVFRKTLRSDSGTTPEQWCVAIGSRLTATAGLWQSGVVDEFQCNRKRSTWILAIEVNKDSTTFKLQNKTFEFQSQPMTLPFGQVDLAAIAADDQALLLIASAARTLWPYFALADDRISEAAPAKEWPVKLPQNWLTYHLTRDIGTGTWLISDGQVAQEWREKNAQGGARLVTHVAEDRDLLVEFGAKLASRRKTLSDEKRAIQRPAPRRRDTPLLSILALYDQALLGEGLLKQLNRYGFDASVRPWLGLTFEMNYLQTPQQNSAETRSEIHQATRKIGLASVGYLFGDIATYEIGPNIGVGRDDVDFKGLSPDNDVQDLSKQTTFFSAGLSMTVSGSIKVNGEYLRALEPEILSGSRGQIIAGFDHDLWRYGLRLAGERLLYDRGANVADGTALTSLAVTQMYLGAFIGVALK